MAAAPRELLPPPLREAFERMVGPRVSLLVAQTSLPVDGSDARTLAFLIDKMGENNIVFGSDYCGGLGPLKKGFAAVDAQSNPEHVKGFTEKNSRRLLHI